MIVYFDNAATTPVRPEVLDAMLPFLKEKFGNPSAIHGFGREVRAAIEKSRKTVAKHLNASTGEIFFTSCGTESNNTAIKGIVSQYGLKHIITSPIEHHCVMYSVDRCVERHGVTKHEVKLLQNGAVDMDDLKKLLSSLEGSVLVSLMHANNEIGILTDIKAVGDLCKEHNAYFHTDTVQTIGHFPIDLQELHVHALTGSAHKFHGPKGIGFLYLNSDIKIAPYIDGGGQERNMRAGTENVSGIIALGKALDIAYQQLDEDKAHISGIKTYMIEQLKETIPGVQFNGDIEGPNLYTVLNVAFPDNPKADFLLYNLDMEGIAVSAGSACSSGADAGSYVINAIKQHPGHKAIRFSFSYINTKEEVDYTVAKLKEMYMVSA